ncbi:hypothetical protein PRIC1_008636 [Phytophthora ramorum]
MDAEDGALSVTSGDSDALSGPPARLPACVLFSLQFYVDRVCLTALPSCAELENALLLGFQLLQYEIVVFDTPLTPSKASQTQSEACVTRLKHGKSCLFEAEPDELVRELRQDAEAPLTLLLLLQERGRARLRAFAAVPLPLNVGLEDDVLSCSRLLRICEWASHSGSWELRDHRNAVVGHVVGAVTLSCLGKALAPHITKALGVQVNRSQPSSPRVEHETKQQTQRPATAVERVEEERCSDEEKKLEKIDSSVQCDENTLVEDRAAESALRGSRKLGAVRTDAKVPTTKSSSSSIEGKLIYYKQNKGATSPRRMSHRSGREPTSSRNAPVNAIKSELLFPLELPPPLFFQKGAKS